MANFVYRVERIGHAFQDDRLVLAAVLRCEPGGEQFIVNVSGPESALADQFIDSLTTALNKLADAIGVEVVEPTPGVTPRTN